MAQYEYYDVDEYKRYIVKRATRKVLYNSNNIQTQDLIAILNDYFDDAYRIIVKWRKLKNDEEFISQKWDKEITDFIVNSYLTMGDDTLNSISINGVNKSYRISPEGQLKSSIPQII